MALIRRSPSNLSKTPGTTTRSVVSGGGLDLAKISIGPGGGSLTTNLRPSAGRTIKQVFEPTNKTLSPQNVIGGQYIQVDKVTGNFQTGEVNVQYSTPTFASSVKKAPIVKTVSNVGQAASVSKLLGRTVQVGEGLTTADIAANNTPGVATPGVGAGFKGGAGYGQAFPISDETMKLAQQAVDIQRIKQLGIKSAYSVKTAQGVNKNVSFTKVETVRKSATPTVAAAPKKTVKNLSLALQGFYK